jgi:hypothetical protein
VCFSDILTSLSGRPSICSRVALLLVATPLAGLLSCAWWLTVWSPVHGPREPTSGYVKLLLPPRQSRGNSLVGLDDAKTGRLAFLWDQLGGCTETAQAASGMEAARSSIGL